MTYATPGECGVEAVACYEYFSTVSEEGAGAILYHCTTVPL